MALPHRWNGEITELQVFRLPLQSGLLEARAVASPRGSSRRGRLPTQDEGSVYGSVLRPHKVQSFGPKRLRWLSGSRVTSRDGLSP